MAAFEAADALWSSCAPSATPAFRTAGAGGEAASYSTETPPAVPAHALATALERSFPEVGRADRVVRFVIQAARPVGQEHAMVSREEWELFLRRFGPFEVCLHKALDSVFDADAASATGRAVLPWFHGATERAATERVLRSASAGHFLVRWSATFPDAFLLVYVRRGGGPRLKHRLLYNHAGHGYAEEPRLSGAVKVYPSIAGYVASQRHVLTHAIYSGLYYECQRELTLPQLPRAVDRARLFNQPLPGPGRYAAAPTYATAGASFGAPQTTAVALGPPPAAKMHNRRNGRIPSAPQSARSVSADSWASTPPAYVVATSPAAVAPPPPAYPLDVAGTRMAVPVHDGVPSARALAAPVSDAPPPSYAEAAGLASAAPVGGDATGLQDSSAGRGGGGPE